MIFLELEDWKRIPTMATTDPLNFIAKLWPYFIQISHSNAHIITIWFIIAQLPTHTIFNRNRLNLKFSLCQRSWCLEFVEKNILRIKRIFISFNCLIMECYKEIFIPLNDRRNQRTVVIERENNTWVRIQLLLL